MSPLRTSVLALGLLAMACAPRTHAVRRNALSSPAPVSRAGTPTVGAGPAPAERRAPAASLDGHEGVRRADPRPVQARLAPPRDQAVRRAVDTASALVGQREIVVGGVRWGDGCAALVRAAFAEAGAPFPSGARDVPALLALARARSGPRRWRPLPGDLAFFADRPGGRPEHVGLVESVSAEGTALVLHRTDQGVLRFRVNGGQPWKLRGESGRALNDVLIVGAGRVPAGRLLVGYATVL